MKKKKDVVSLSKNPIKQRSDNYLDWTITKAQLYCTIVITSTIREI